ncbi:phage tail protein [Enterobacter wuhouensis]|uniref:phage tail tip fiber protein n=1 Tax=Enterobacter wuhouensis TaxID=2529381 RepID=UPI002FD0D704
MEKFKKKRLPALIAGAGGSSGSSSQRMPREADDTVNSRAMASILDLLGEGKIGGLVNGGKSIFLNDTPLLNDDETSNFSGVTWWFRDGSQDQEVVPGFDIIETPKSINTRAKSTQPVTFSVDNDEADHVRVIIKFPKLTSTDKKTGDTNGTTLKYGFQIASGNGGFVDVVAEGEKSATISMTAKKSSVYYRSYTLALPKPGKSYRVRFSRYTDDSGTDYLANETYVDSMGEIVSTSLNYPNSALVGIKINSEQFGNSMPSRSYLVKGIEIRVPSNYDPVNEEYVGIWDGTYRTMSSGNPAWILYDLLTNPRYGLGEFVHDSLINVGQLYQIGRYCDELVDDGFGGKEKRFSINTQITTRRDAYKLVQDIAGAFRGMVYWAGGMVHVTQDSPSDPVMLFTNSNVINGEFTYKGSARKDRPSVALITYNNKEDNYKQNIEYVEDPEAVKRFGIRKTDSVAFGCTSRGMAHRVGLWTLYTSRMESDVIAFSVGLDSAFLMPGDVALVQDRYRSGRRNSGRISGFTANSFTLDAPVQIDKANSFISVMTAEGKIVERDILETGNVTKVTFKNALEDSEVPTDNAVWILTQPDLKPMQVRILSITQGDDPGTFQIAAVQNNPTKYDAIDNGASLIAQNTTVLDPTYSKPENLLVEEGTYFDSPGNLGVKLILTWEGKSPRYWLSWRRSDTNDNWQMVQVLEEQYELKGVNENGKYDFEVYGVSVGGRNTEKINATYQVLGTMTPPDAPTQLTAVGDYRTIILNWANPSSVDLDKINVYVSNKNDLSTAGLLASVSSTTFTHSGLGDDETWFYWVRAVNKRGMLSAANAALGTEATTKDVLSFLKNKITASELGQDLLADINQSAAKEAVEEVNKRIDESVGELNKSVDELEQSVTGVKQSVTDMQNSFTGMEKEQNDLKTSVQDTADKVSQALADVDDATANVVALQETVKKQGESVASTLDAAQAALDGSKTLIAEEKQARVDGDEAIGKKVDTMQSVVDTGQASIDEMKQTVSNVEKSAAQWSSSLEATAKANIDLALRQEEDKKQQASTNAAVNTSQQVLTDSVSSVAKRVDEMKAEIGDDIAAQLQEERETRASADEAVSTQLTQLKAQVNDDVKASLATEQQARADADSALSKQVTNLQSQVNTDVKAQIAAEAKTRADRDSALSSQITSLSAQVNDDVTAQIATESKARTDGDTALSSKVDTLATKTTSDIKAAVATETKARTDGDSALSSQISSLETQTAADIKAAVATETKARTDGDTALGSQITSLKTQTAADIKAAVATETKARTDADSAMASDISALETRAGKIESSVTSEQTARANADTAMGKRVDTVSAKADSVSSTVQQTSQAVADVNAKVSASWTLKMETSTAGGQKYAAGIALGIDGTGLSQFLIRADRFGLVNSVDGKITTPFVIENSVAYMSGAYIKDGTISNAKIGDMQSTNYVANRTGWRISKSGNFEMNGNSGGNGRVVMNNLRTDVYDDNNVLRVRIGQL